MFSKIVWRSQKLSQFRCHLGAAQEELIPISIERKDKVVLDLDVNLQSEFSADQARQFICRSRLPSDITQVAAHAV